MEGVGKVENHKGMLRVALGSRPPMGGAGLLWGGAGLRWGGAGLRARANRGVAIRDSIQHSLPSGIARSQGEMGAA